MGGAIGSAEYSSIFNVFNFGNVTVKPFDKGSSSEGKVYVGGVTGYAGHGIVNSFNLGQVSAEKVNYLGGIAGRSCYLPVDDSKTAEARAKNRRTEIILTPKLDVLYELTK